MHKLCVSILCLLLLLALYGEVHAVSRILKSTREITSLDIALKAEVPVVVKLGSDRCPPCRAMKPILKELAVEQDGKAVFLDLDVYRNQKLAREYNVMVIPTILFYDKRGKFKTKVEGFMSKDQVLAALTKVNGTK